MPNQAGETMPPQKPHKESPPAPPWWRGLALLLTPWGWTLLALSALALVGMWYLYSCHEPRDEEGSKEELVILQLNDTYRLDAVRGGTRGGLARVATLLRQLKAQHRHVIVLHAGDFLSPSLESDSFGGGQMIDALNFLHAIAPLYAVPGNHEFDSFDKNSDPETLAAAINRSRFHWVASNLERENPALLAPLRDRAAERLVLPFGKLKLGLFALTLDAAHGGRDRDYAPIAGNYAAVARREIARLEAAGADLIVGLTHLDIEDDRELASLRREHPRFGWIAGGHEHYLQRETGWPGAALITKSESNARTVWKITVSLRGRQIAVREESLTLGTAVPADAEFARDVEGFYHRQLRQQKVYLDELIAEQPGRCYDATEEVVRERESDWGSFLADQMRRAHSGTPAQVAVLHGGSIRIDDTFCDRFTFEHLERTFAFDTKVVYVELKGKDLREQILESSVNSKRGDGRFLQVSGVRFRPERDGSGRIALRDLKVESGNGWADLEDDSPYTIAVPEYLFRCNDNYRFRNYAARYVEPGPDLRALTYEALKAADQRSAAQKATAASATPQRIISLPSYAAPFTRSAPGWKPMGPADRACP